MSKRFQASAPLSKKENPAAEGAEAGLQDEEGNMEY
jgi:hypothetical protein